MLKNLSGGAVINYGPTLPDDSTAFDGAVFFLTKNSGGKTAGLYVFSMDANTPSQHWRAIVSEPEEEEVVVEQPDSAFSPYKLLLLKHGII